MAPSISEIRRRVQVMASENSFVTGVILFGSIARGEAEEKSDVDLLVLWEGLELSREVYRYIYRVAAKYLNPSWGLTVLETGYWNFLAWMKLRLCY